MQKRKMNRQGFGVVGVVVVVTALVVAGFTGTAIYRQTHKTRTVATVATTMVTKVATNANPYAGWKVATLKFEKATFEYPSSWALRDSSWVQSDTPGIPMPWADTATVTSPTGMMVYISTGDEIFNNPRPNPTILATQPISALGGDYNLDFFAYGPRITPGSLDEACVSASSSGLHFGYISSRTLTQAAGEPGTPAQDSICMTLAAKHDGPSEWTVSTYEHDSSFHDAKLVIESLKYQE